jgi:hypothetical protein
MSPLDEHEPEVFSQPEGSGFKPWEQRIGPGMGGGGSTSSSTHPEPELPGRINQELEHDGLSQVIDQQTRLTHYPLVNRFATAQTDLVQAVTTNEEAWRLFVEERLYDTRRVKLEHFHLFEWFPLSPGRFHTQQAKENRWVAAEMMVHTKRGFSFFNPYGKASMIRGGVGAVRLRPRLVSGEPHYFMTASSNGVCHEGFPVLIPRRFYGALKRRLLSEGVVPVNLEGEMRYLFDELPSFFESYRELPQLFLHVDNLQVLPRPRNEVTNLVVSVALSFIGQYEGKEGMYATFGNFDPSSTQSLQKTINWLGKFYVTEQYKGVVVTDFDEVQPRFEGAIFGLPELMSGRLDSSQVKEFLKKYGFWENAGQKFYVVYKQINTGGGAYIEGNVHIEGGDFIGRDKIIKSK